MSKKKKDEPNTDTRTTLPNGKQFEVIHDLSGVAITEPNTYGEEDSVVALTWTELDELWNFCKVKAPSARMKDLQSRKTKLKEELSEIESQINTIKLQR